MMRKAEIILIVLTLIALGMKYFQVPFSGLLFVLSINLLAILYYPLGVLLFSGKSLRSILAKSGFKKLNRKRSVLGFFVGLGLATTLIGTLFKLQLWPNGNILLRMGLVCLAICAAFILFGYKKRSEFSNMILKRMMLWGGIGLIVFLISNDSLIDHFYSERSAEYREMTKEYYRDTSNQELQEKLRKMDDEHYKHEFE